LGRGTVSAVGRGSFPFRADETAETVPLIDQKIKRRLCAMLDVGHDIKTGLRHHYKEEISAGKVSGSKMKKEIVE
jgi:hypothetical protein